MTKQSKNLEIEIEFFNYKLLKDKSWVLKGSYIYFIQGPNATGKTSFLTALQGAMTAKDITDKKVSVNEDGEDSGHYEFTIPAADGSMVTIRNEFTDKKNKFIAIKESGEKVSQVGEIRQIFNYTPINVNEFFQMSRTADGRRRQRDIILKLLPDDQREKFEELDLQEQHYFSERTAVGNDKKAAEGYMKSVVIAEEDLNLLSKEKQANELLDAYQKSYTNIQRNQSIQDVLDNLNEEAERLQDRLKAIDDEYAARRKEITDVKFTTDDLESKIAKGKEVTRRITEIKAKKTLHDESSDKIDNLSSKYDELSIKISDRRLTKSKIVSEADLPVSNISFEEDYLVIDDFKFDETQVCESDAVLLLANILAKINPGPIQVIGDASILDAKKLEELNRIAEANNKVMFVDEVIRDADNMVVVGYEQLLTKIPSTKGKKDVGSASEKPTKTKTGVKVTHKREPVEPPKTMDELNKPNDKPLF